MNAEQKRVLEAVSQYGPSSCLRISAITGIARPRVYRVLYRLRDYGNGLNYVRNQKPETDTATFATPGQYAITEKGREALGVLV